MKMVKINFILIKKRVYICVCVCMRACMKGFLDKYISVTTWRPKQKILTLSPVVQD